MNQNLSLPSCMFWFGAQYLSIQRSTTKCAGNQSGEVALSLKPQDEFKHSGIRARKLKNDRQKNLCAIYLISICLLYQKDTRTCVLLYGNIIVIFIIIHCQCSPPSKIKLGSIHSVAEIRWTCTLKCREDPKSRKDADFWPQLHPCLQSYPFCFVVSLSRSSKKDIQVTSFLPLFLTS